MLIAIEGIDGSGKGTQAQLLIDRMKAANIECVLHSFPGYKLNPYGELVGRYLNGDFGDKVAPELAAVLYAGDRLTKKAEIDDQLKSGITVVCDRYIDSNLAHQSARVAGTVEQANLRQLIYRIEYVIHGMPPPALTVYLDMPLFAAARNVAAKKARTYTDKRADLHEADRGHLAATQRVYTELARVAGPNGVVIQCCDGGPDSDVRGYPVIRTPEAISEEIWGHVLRKRSPAFDARDRK